MTQYKGKVIDEPNEWVAGELIKYGNSYYIKQTIEPPGSNCGIGTFEVIPESVEEAHRLSKAQWREIYQYCEDNGYERPSALLKDLKDQGAISRQADIHSIATKPKSRSFKAMMNFLTRAL